MDKQIKGYKKKSRQGNWKAVGIIEKRKFKALITTNLKFNVADGGGRIIIFNRAF